MLVLVASSAFVLFVTVRDQTHAARCGPLLAARIEASVEEARPFWQQPPDDFQTILDAAEAMLEMEMDGGLLSLGPPDDFLTILDAEIEHGCVDEDDKEEVLRRWWSSSLSPFDPRNAGRWDLDNDGSLNVDEQEVLRQRWEAARSWPDPFDAENGHPEG